MRRFLASSICFCILLIIFGCGKSETIATLKNPQGEVSLRESGSSPFRPAKDKDILPDRSGVRTGNDGQAKLAFPEKGELSLDRNTYFEIRKGDTLGLQDSGKVIYRIEKQNGKSVSVETPHGVTTVLGTIFNLTVNSEATTLVVEEGKVAFSPKGGGEQKVITPGNQLVVDSSGKVKSMGPLPELNPGLVHPK